MKDADFHKKTFLTLKCRDCGELADRTDRFEPKSGRDSCCHEWTVLKQENALNKIILVVVVLVVVAVVVFALRSGAAVQAVGDQTGVVAS